MDGKISLHFLIRNKFVHSDKKTILTVISVMKCIFLVSMQYDGVNWIAFLFRIEAKIATATSLN